LLSFVPRTCGWNSETKTGRNIYFSCVKER
jgi:hypothetical protein